MILANFLVVPFLWWLRRTFLDTPRMWYQPAEFYGDTSNDTSFRVSLRVIP